MKDNASLKIIEIYKDVLSYSSFSANGVEFEVGTTVEGNKIYVQRLRKVVKEDGDSYKYAFTLGYFDTARQAARAIYTASKFLGGKK